METKGPNLTQENSYKGSYLAVDANAGSYAMSSGGGGRDYASYSTANTDSTLYARPTRTPSPTPSDIEELKKGVFDWKTILNWRTYAKKKYIVWYIAIALTLTLVALMTLYHKQIVHWLTPATKWMHDLKFGWIIPIAVLFVISFPPLFGHEIVAVLCGVVWGLWIGFAIVAAGTFLGEIGNFYAFRYCCKARGDKMEKNNLSYACLVKVVQEGGFLIAFVARISAIPGHFTTAVFSTCGMNIWVFSLAAFLSLPKQLVTVYLGVILETSGEGPVDTKTRIIQDVVLVVSFLATIFAAWYIYDKMAKAKPAVLRDRRRARAAKLPVSDYSSEHLTASITHGAFNPRDSESSVDLHQDSQRWDTHGHAIEVPWQGTEGQGWDRRAVTNPQRRPTDEDVEATPQRWNSNNNQNNQESELPYASQSRPLQPTTIAQPKPQSITQQQWTQQQFLPPSEAPYSGFATARLASPPQGGATSPTPRTAPASNTSYPPNPNWGNRNPYSPPTSPPPGATVQSPPLQNPYSPSYQQSLQQQQQQQQRSFGHGLEATDASAASFHTAHQGSAPSSPFSQGHSLSNPTSNMGSPFAPLAHELPQVQPATPMTARDLPGMVSRSNTAVGAPGQGNIPPVPTGTLQQQHQAQGQATRPAQPSVGWAM